ncbi:MAG: hypothetical protein K5876_06400 [Ruminiclostridium sp.]|nr:hypothetical protein [Ruminiclostridium sp.]
MNKRKHYGRKIKKTRNLYRRKKSTGQKIFGTVMLVVAVAAIAFLGFCIGKPLLDYIGSIGTKEIPEWTPADSYVKQQETEPAAVSAASAGTTSAPETAEAFNTTPPAPAEPEIAVVNSLAAVEVPSGALANSSSLSAVLAKARAGGYNAATIQLKDRKGYLHYKSGIEEAEDLVKGSMTLDDIMAVFNENKMVPIAQISLLADQAGCEVFTDMSYKIKNEGDISWLDYSTGAPLRWANPDSSATREYNARITAELMTAGFDEIIATDLIFPDFQNYDRAYIEDKYFRTDRFRMLYNVVKAGYLIEMKASDVLADPLGRTAETLRDPSQLRSNSIALVIGRKDLPADAGYPAEARSFVETVLSIAGGRTGGIPIVPVIESSGFDDAERIKIIGLLGELGYERYIIR